MNALARLSSSPPLLRACRIAIGLVLLLAALGKIGDPVGFAAQIRHFRLLPPGAENLPAIVLPWLELLAGLALVLNVRARSGAWLAAGMLCAFTFAVILAVARGLDIECGCFGTADGSRVGAAKLAENLGFTALALLASRRGR